MISLNVSTLLPPVVSFALALALTPVVRLAARHFGLVAKPKTDRWHKKPTAMMGGIAIWLSVLTTYIFFCRTRRTRGSLSVSAASYFLWVWSMT